MSRPFAKSRRYSMSSVRVEYSECLGISAVRNVKQVVESSENRISLVVFMMGEYSEKFFIQRVFGDSVKMVQPGQSSPTNIESRGDVFVRPVENLDQLVPVIDLLEL